MKYHNGPEVSTLFGFIGRENLQLAEMGEVPRFYLFDPFVG